MALKDYSTTIDVHRTIGEIQGTLVDHGATAVVTEYEAKVPVGLAFQIKVNGELLSFRLPVRIEAVRAVLVQQAASNRGITLRHQTQEHAARVGWRILRDWVAAQMAIIETEMVQLDEVFLPYRVIGDGRLLYEAIAAPELPRLLAGGEG